MTNTELLAKIMKRFYLDKEYNQKIVVYLEAKNQEKKKKTLQRIMEIEQEFQNLGKDCTHLIGITTPKKDCACLFCGNEISNTETSNLIEVNDLSGETLDYITCEIIRMLGDPTVSPLDIVAVLQNDLKNMQNRR